MQRGIIFSFVVSFAFVAVASGFVITAYGAKKNGAKRAAVFANAIRKVAFAFLVSLVCEVVAATRPVVDGDKTCFVGDSVMHGGQCRELSGSSKTQGVRLFLAGASTLEDGGERPGLYPYASWGRELEFSMKAGNEVVNFAVSGHSTKSFEADGYWAKLMADVRRGD